MKRVLPILVLALAIPALVNCKKEEKDEPTPPPPVKVETISVNPDKIEINDGDTRNLSVTVAPANAENINEDRILHRLVVGGQGDSQRRWNRTDDSPHARRNHHLGGDSRRQAQGGLQCHSETQSH